MVMVKDWRNEAERHEAIPLLCHESRLDLVAKDNVATKAS
jgi:hypothetical protein